MLQLAEADERVVAGAAVGSLAVGSGDRFSDLDLTFGIADGVPVAHVLDGWTRMLTEELDAVQLADLKAGPTIYRVFLLPDALQFDLSMTSATEFRPAGPRFQLLFGETAPDESEVRRRSQGGIFIPTPAVAGDLFGWGIIYALHARACIERGRVWQAEHYVGAVRDHALSPLPFLDRSPEPDDLLLYSEKRMAGGRILAMIHLMKLSEALCDYIHVGQVCFPTLVEEGEGRGGECSA